MQECDYYKRASAMNKNVNRIKSKKRHKKRMIEEQYYDVFSITVSPIKILFLIALFICIFNINIVVAYLTDSDIRVNAFTVEANYTITFDSTLGTTTTQELSYNVETNLNSNSFSRTGYNFSGWKDGNGNNYTNGQKVNNLGDITLYAQWTLIPYTITYNLNNGSATNPTTYYVTTETFTLTNPTRTGYTFDGWTGTGVTNSKAVTISKGSTGNRNYTANWTANTNTAYVVNHYVHDNGANTYSINSTENKTGTSDASLTLANLKKTITGYTYENGFANAGNTTKPTSGAVTTTTIKPDGTRVINLYYRPNYLYVQYDMNTGSLAQNHGADYSSVGSLISNAAGTDTKYLRGFYGSKVGDINTTTYATSTSSGLHNWNNSSHINIEKVGYSAKSGAQWNTKANGTGTSYNQDTTTYEATSMATACGVDLGTGDKTITLYVNWTPNTNTPYTVIHKQEQSDGTYIEKEREQLTGTSDANVTPAVKTYEGWISPSTQTVKVNPAGTTVVTYLYEKMYYVTLVAGNGISSVTGQGYYKKGTSVTVSATVYDCATWANWTGNGTQTSRVLTFTMPSNQLSLTANATANNSATTHNWQIATQTAATCESDSTEAQYCTKCGATKVTHLTAKLGHTADTSKDVVVAATCTTSGYTKHYCIRCGNEFVDTYTNALGHNYVNGTCTRCNDFDIEQLSPGLYTVSGTTYTPSYTWQQLVDNGIFTINSSGLLILNDINTTTGYCKWQSTLNGFLVLPNTVKTVNSSSLYVLRYLTGIFISKSVTSWNTVWQLQRLKSIYVSSESTSLKIVNGSLYSKDGKTLYLAPRQITGGFNIQSGCTLVMDCAFQQTSYSSITIPSTVTQINGGAFRDMGNLTTLNIPASVTTIGSGITVSDTNLTSLNVDSNNPNYTAVNGVIYNKAMTSLFQVAPGKSGALNILDTVQRIEGNAVDGCSKLTSISIPDKVTYMGNWAFSGCTNVTSINIPSKITTINTGTYSSIKAPVTIPSSVTVIYRSNFNNSAQTSVTFADTSHTWKLSLVNNGTAVSGVPTSAFSVANPSTNATYFKSYVYYNWTRQ